MKYTPSLLAVAALALSSPVQGVHAADNVVTFAQPPQNPIKSIYVASPTEATHAVGSVGAIAEGDTLVCKFTLQMQTNEAESLVSLNSSASPIKAYRDMTYTLRAKDGIFDAYHGNQNGGPAPAANYPAGFNPSIGFTLGFGTLERLAWSKAVNYHVKMEIDPRARTYSVWVAPEFADAVKIAEDFSARTVVDDIDGIYFANVMGSSIDQLSNGTMVRGSQLKKAVTAVNEATDTAKMAAALEAPALGLPLQDYTALDTAKRAEVAKAMLDTYKKNGAYADDLAILRNFERAVAKAANANANAPAQPGNPRFTITTPGGTSPEYHFRARGYLDWDAPENLDTESTENAEKSQRDSLTASPSPSKNLGAPSVPSVSSVSSPVRYYSIHRATYDPAKKAYGEDAEIARVVPGAFKLWYNNLYIPPDIPPQPDTRFIDGSVKPDNKYRYRIIAYNRALAPSEPAETEVTFPPRKDVPAGYFTNPAYVQGEGAFRAGDHYYVVTCAIQDNRHKVVMRKGSSITGLMGPATPLFEAVPDTDHAAGFMAAKAHYLKFPGEETGRWYIYFSAGAKNSAGHTDLANDNCHVIAGGTDPRDPMNGTYEYKGKMETGLTTNNIDPKVITIDGKHYFLNSCGGIRIFAMENAWTLTTRVNGSDDRSNNITHNQRWNGGLEWYNYHGNISLTYPGITEAAAPLYGPGGEIYIVYSANQTFTTQYCIGFVEYLGGDPLLPASWKVHPDPAFVTSEENGVWGPGHSINVPSPDDPFEVWSICGAMQVPDETGHAWIRPYIVNKITWERRAEDGKKAPQHVPRFGAPAASGALLPLPKGEEKLKWRTIKVTQNEGGDVWPLGEMRIADGDTRMVIIRPDPGRRIANITRDGAPVPTTELRRNTTGTTNYYLTEVTADGKLHIEFQ